MKHTIELPLLKRLLVSVIPEYMDMFNLMTEHKGWLPFTDEFVESLQNLKIEWWSFYEDEKKLRMLGLLMVIPQDELNSYTNKESITALAEEMAECLEDGEPIEAPTEEEKKEWISKFDNAPKDEQLEISKQIAFFFYGYMLNLSQYLALMIHGKSMVQLVAEAKAGNDESFRNAVHIDRMTLYIPEFQNRMMRAQLTGDSVFLGKLANQIRNPISKSKRSTRILWLLFAMLEDNNYLDLPIKDIVEICDELDIWDKDFPRSENAIVKNRRAYKKLKVPSKII